MIENKYKEEESLIFFMKCLSISYMAHGYTVPLIHPTFIHPLIWNEKGSQAIIDV